MDVNEKIVNGVDADLSQHDEISTNSSKKKGGHFVRNTLLAAGTAAVIGFGVSTYGNFGSEPQITKSQQLSAQFPNGRYLDDLSIVDSSGKSVFSGKIPGFVYSNKKTELDRVNSHVPKGMHTLSTSVNGKKVKFENSSFNPAHAGDKIKLVVGKKPEIYPLGLGPIVPHKPVVSTKKLIKSSLEQTLTESSPKITPQKTFDFKSELNYDGKMHSFGVDYTQNMVSIDGGALILPFSGENGLESELLETINGKFGKHSLMIGENALSFAEMLILSGHYDKPLQSAVIVDSLARLNVQAQIIDKYFTKSTNVHERVAGDMRIKYLNGNVSDVQARNIQEKTDVKAYTYNPSPALKGERGKIVHMKTDLVERMEDASTTSIDKLSSYLDSTQDSKTFGKSGVIISSSKAKEMALWNVVNKKISGKDLGKMALGMGSYGSTFYAVSKTEFNPLSQVNAGFKDNQRASLSVANYTLTRNSSLDDIAKITAAMTSSVGIYKATFENGMRTLGGNK